MNGFPKTCDDDFNERIARYTGDPVAQKIAWSFIGALGENFDGYIIKKTSSIYIIKTSVQNKILTLTVVIFALVLIHTALSNQLHPSLPWMLLFLAAASLILCGVAFRLFNICVKVFDKDAQLFFLNHLFKKRQSPIPFSQIHALQLIPVISSSGDCGDNTTVELDLVLNDGRRIFLAELCELSAAKDAATALSSHIGGAPIWDIWKMTMTAPDAAYSNAKPSSQEICICPMTGYIISVIAIKKWR